MRLSLYLVILVFSLHIDTVRLPAAVSFSLSDSNPNSPSFRRRFMASHGVNEAIEPKLTVKDRPLQKAIIPLIKTDPRRAIQLIEADLKPDSNPAFLNILGNLYYQLNDYQNAERYLQKALGEFPSLRRSWRTLALSYVQRDLMDLAIEPLLKVIKLGGGDAQSYGLLAYSYLNTQKYESALAAYRMARMFDPESFDFRRGQAICLLKTEQLRSAIALFDELIVEKPEEPSFWLAQANAFLTMQQPDKAIANLQMVADSGNSTWESLTMLGDLYLNHNVPKLAMESYSLAFHQHPPRKPSQVVRPLNYLVNRKLYKEAREFYQLIAPKITAELDPESQRRVNIAKARIEMSIGDPEKALNILTHTVEENPLDGATLMLLGDYYRDTGQFEESEYFFERATSVREFAVDAFVALGQLEVDRGNLKAALLPLRKAEELETRPSLQRYVESIERALRLRQ
jgi:tetratricopeptide (TPR) repeat protein